MRADLFVPSNVAISTHEAAPGVCAVLRAFRDNRKTGKPELVRVVVTAFHPSADEAITDAVQTHEAAQ